MGMFDRLRRKSGEDRKPIVPVPVGITNPIVPNSVGIGRKSKDDQYDLFGGSPFTLLPPPTSDQDWQAFTLDATTFSRIAPARVLELLADMSPEVSKALWDYLRMCNPGWDFDVFHIGTERRHREGYRVVKETLDNWAYNGGSLDTLFARLDSAAFLRGALFSEIVFDTDARTCVAMVTPDPISVRFRKEQRGILGDVWQLGQMQDGMFVALDRPTVQYLPIDPNPGIPYGRPLASASIFTGLFLLGLLHDLRRVIAQQGYPRIDISIDTDVLLRMAPPEVRTSAEKLQKWIDGVITQVKTAYSGLGPSDAYIHVSAIQLKDSVGVIGNESLGSLSGIISSLERMSIRALKTMPIFMAVMEGSSDSNSNRQWEMQAQGIKAIQHLKESMIERHLSVVLQANGIQAIPKWRFAELRSSEGLRDEQTRTLFLANTTTEYTMGWISHEEASIKATGKPPAEDEPLVMPGAPTKEPPPNADDENPDDDGSSPDPQQQKVVSIGGPIVGQGISERDAEKIGHEFRRATG